VGAALAMCKTGAMENDFPETQQFFHAQREDKANRFCIDCGAHSPQWASVTYGCYMCLECSGQHRHVGTHISFVRSTTMDKWKVAQLQMMALGGNARLRAVLQKYGVADGMAIEEKYHTRACQYYREALRAQVDGAQAPEPPNIEEGRKIVRNSMKISAPTPSAKAAPLLHAQDAQNKEPGHMDAATAVMEQLLGGWLQEFRGLCCSHQAMKSRSQCQARSPGLMSLTVTPLKVF